MRSAYQYAMRDWPALLDQALFAALKANIRPGIPVIEMPENINDAAFADRAAGLLFAMVGATRP